MTRTVWLYIYVVLLTSCMLIVAAWPDSSFATWDWSAFLVLTALVIPTQFFDAVNGRQSYFLHTVFFFAGAILLPTPLFVLVVVIPHVVEWLHKRLTNSPLLRQWYIQPFNIGTHVVAGLAAQWLFISLGGGVGVFSFQSSVLAPTVAILAYVLVNHLLVGQVLVLARGMTWRESGTLDSASLLTDVVMMFVGFGIAALWSLSPWLMAPAVAPLVLIYRALTVPELQREAQTDAKTGLWNARHFDRLFSSELEKSQSQSRQLTLVMADLDLLRNINNTYGHLAGDTVLAGVAGVIRENIRDGDFASRFGGEEFAIVLPGAGEVEGRATAERLRRAVEAASFKVSSSPTPIQVTMSLGFACFPAHAQATRDLIHEADVALYQAKLSGRNTVRSASEVPHAVKLDFDSPARASDHKSQHDQYEAAFKSIAHSSDPLSLGQLDLPQAEIGGAGVAGQESLLGLDEGVPAASGPTRRSLRPPSDWLSNLGSRGSSQSSSSSSSFSSTSSLRKGPVSTPRPPLSAQLWLFLGVTIAAAALITLVRSVPLLPMDLTALILLVVLAAAAELLQVQIYGENTVSVSMSVLFATALILGIPGVAVVSATIVVVHFFRMRPPFYRTAFNWAVHVLAAAMPVVWVRDLRFEIGLANLPLLSVLSALAAMLYYGIETGLVAAAMSMTLRKVTVVEKWREQFQWLAKHYLVLGLLGLFLAVAHGEMGSMGLLVFVLPVFMMHLTQKEYVRGTETGMIELRRMNQELAVANQEISNANLAIQRLNDQLFQVLAKIIDARDPYVSGHAIQVSDYAVSIAKELDLPDHRVDQMRQAGLLHDIGKIGISDAILNKPARLTDNEYENVKGHVTLGADFLETCNGLQGLAPFIRHHHEWWDGNGYPGGLKGKKIPLESRILAVCDSVEAMASDRPYQAALPAQEIIAELRRCAGTQFDPAIVDAFIQVLEREGLQFIVNTAIAVSKNRPDIRAKLAQPGAKTSPVSDTLLSA